MAAVISMLHERPEIMARIEQQQEESISHERRESTNGISATEVHIPTGPPEDQQAINITGSHTPFALFALSSLVVGILATAMSYLPHGYLS